MSPASVVSHPRHLIPDNLFIIRFITFDYLSCHHFHCVVIYCTPLSREHAYSWTGESWDHGASWSHLVEPSKCAQPLLWHQLSLKIDSFVGCCYKPWAPFPHIWITEFVDNLARAWEFLFLEASWNLSKHVNTCCLSCISLMSDLQLKTA